MNRPLLDMPDQFEQLIPWLEERLLGDDLAALVADLSAVHGSVSQPRSLAEVLGERRVDVLQHGLSVLKSDQITALLQQPTLLWELSELLLIEGGTRWRRPPNSEQREQADRGWASLQQSLQENEGVNVPVTASPRESHSSLRTAVVEPQRKETFGQTLIIIASIAAVIGIAVWLGRMQDEQVGLVDGPDEQEQPVGWGFNSPDALAVDLEPAEYLQHLARSASAWYNKTPETPEALQERLEQFRDGCETLLTAEHAQLAAEDKAWLLERCQAWIEKIDGHLADITAGERPFGAVKSEANATIDLMIEKLEERADQV